MSDIEALDRGIEEAKKRLSDLYRQRRELLASLKKPRKKKISDVELLAKAKIEGQTLESLAKELGITPDYLKYLIWQALIPWQEDDPASRYKAALKANNQLAEGCRLSKRKLWPWRDNTSPHGLTKDDPRWLG